MLRKRSLPEGWYPQDAREAARDLERCLARAAAYLGEDLPEAVAAVSPHASWFYSGALSAAAVGSLSRAAETVVVFGGHLSERAVPLAAPEDGFETPLGPLSADAELRDELVRRFGVREDRFPDNTVEIVLPLVKRLFPAARIVWLRVPASAAAYELGRAAAEAAAGLGRTAVAVGSTDLTHYGPHYGFMPEGLGPEALSWVRGVNDRRFIEALLEGDAEKALTRAAEECSACSPGAAAAALGFARASGAERCRLLGYATSADSSPASSFVGYAALSWERRGPAAAPSGSSS